MSKRKYSCNRDLSESKLFNFIDNTHMHEFIKESLKCIDDECEVHPYYTTEFNVLSTIANALGEERTNEFLYSFTEGRGISNIWNAVIEAEPTLAKSPHHGKTFTYDDLFNLGHDLAFCDVNKDRDVYDIKFDIDKLYDNEINIGEAPVNKLLLVTQSDRHSAVLAGSVLAVKQSNQKIDLVQANPIKAYKKVYHTVGPNMVDHLTGNAEGIVLVNGTATKVVVMEDVVEDKVMDTVDVEFHPRFSGEVSVNSFLSQLNPVGINKLNLRLFFRGNELATKAEIKIGKASSSLTLIKLASNKAGFVRVPTKFKVETADTLDETINRLFKELTLAENEAKRRQEDNTNPVSGINNYYVLEAIDDALNQINNVKFESATLISGYNRAQFLVSLANKFQQARLVNEKPVIKVVEEILAEADLANVENVHAKDKVLADRYSGIAKSSSIFSN